MNPHIPTPETPLPVQQQKLLALGQLAGGMAHDFNNILSIIEGYARMLQRHCSEDSFATEKLAHIQMATRRGAGLTKQLLTFGRQNIRADQTCDLAAVVRENEILLHPLLSPRIQLTVLTPDTPVTVTCDPDTISQVLINLATNARDAIREEGKVRIEVIATETKAFLLVTDDGAGIEHTILPKIFDPFFTTKEQGKGTGLGLSMIAGEMQRLGGGIHVESTPGSGTCFTLEFPLTTTAVDTKRDALFAADQSLLQQKTILVVDDEEEFLPVIEDDLTRMGLKVLKAANADRAMVLQAHYQDSIDLLLTDVVMPGMSGLKLAEAFAQARPEAGIVFMTGYPARGETAQTRDLAFPENALILPKPLALEQVSATLQKALDRLTGP